MRLAGRNEILSIAVGVRCLIVDDSVVFLAAARALLEREGFTVVDAVTNGSQCLDAVAELQPDVVLLDMDLGSESGLDVAGRLARSGSLAAVILISTHEGPEYADLARDSGALGFLPKSALSKQAVDLLLHPNGRRGP